MKLWNQFSSLLVKSLPCLYAGAVDNSCRQGSIRMRQEMLINQAARIVSNEYLMISEQHDAWSGFHQAEIHAQVYS